VILVEEQQFFDTAELTTFITNYINEKAQEVNQKDHKRDGA